ncbi:MAG TPA: ABC transporter ATP-binding protein [Fervidobacterium sp.]|nr:ABC transporter ATP-binding protein [Fervidobacterium sp.]NLH36646.1 ABC transporter ATP-binding protein [Thermotogaceae bacterium]MBP9517926.1 ABC transporter ATP-binding protein [Fervidobacterium sp.]HOP82087.1 ABC transporter ATP-binding protein [Fervidobacterium sp.]HPC79910.1 ABC transporter ATP-binding protein [Fervidobacterium sp.]
MINESGAQNGYVTLVKLENVSKHFEKLNIFNDLSFEIVAGQSVALLGPSGCGKTTLIRMIADLDDDYTGKISRNYRKIGYVFQEPRLIPWKSIYDNLRFVLEDDEKINEALKIMKLDGFQDYKPAKLSGGMRQRVNLARALLDEPDLLLLDEPFTSLDLHTKLSIIEDILEGRNQRTFSMIIVTHDVREALLMADRIILLSNKPTRILEELDVSQVPKDIMNAEFLKKESEILNTIVRRWSEV